MKSYFCKALPVFDWFHMKNAAGWRSNVSAFSFFRWWHAFNSKACKCLSMGRVFLKRRKLLHWLDLLTAPYRWFARWPILSELHVLRRTCTKRGSPRPATPQCTSVCSIHICQFLQATLTAGNMSKAEKQRSFMAVSFSRRGVKWRSVACQCLVYQRDIMGFKMKMNSFSKYSSER